MGTDVMIGAGRDFSLTGRMAELWTLFPRSFIVGAMMPGSDAYTEKNIPAFR